MFPTNPLTITPLYLSHVRSMMDHITFLYFGHCTNHHAKFALIILVGFRLLIPSFTHEIMRFLSYVTRVVLVVLANARIAESPECKNWQQDSSLLPKTLTAVVT